MKFISYFNTHPSLEHVVAFRTANKTCDGRSRSYKRVIIGAPVIAVSVLVFVLGSGIASGAEIFTARGELRYTAYSESRGTSILERRFEVSVSNCNWTIQTDLVDNPTIVSFWDCFDGTNLFSIACFAEGSSSASDSAGTVEKTEVPQLTHSTGAPQVWLAYASPCYFRSLTSNLAVPLWSTGNRILRASGYRVPVSIRRSDECPSMIEEISYYSDGISYAHDGIPIGTELQAPYNKGFQRAVYRVLSATNVQGLCVPMSFVYEEFRPIANGRTTNDLFKMLTIEGGIFSLVPEPQNPLKRGFSRSRIEDLRRVDTNSPMGIVYTMTNGQLLALDSKEFQRALDTVNERIEIAAVASAHPVPSNSAARWIVRAVLIFVIIGFPLAVYRGMKKANK